MNVTEKQKKLLEKIGKEYDLKFIILHGSYAKDTPREGSDLDIAALGNAPIDGEKYLKLFGEFSNIFGDSKERELDFKTLHNTDPFFRYQIVKDGTLLYGNKTDYEEFKLYAYRAYADSADLRDLEDTLLQKSIQKLTKEYV